jgi:hypothetical protein
MLCVCNILFFYGVDNNYAVQSQLLSYAKRLSGLEHNGEYWNVLEISYMPWNYREQAHVYADPRI